MMHFSIGCGLSFMLLFLLVQGEFKSENTYSQGAANGCFEQKEDAGCGCEANHGFREKQTPGLELCCCSEVWTDIIQEAVTACFEQKEFQTDCNIQAYIFVGKSKRCYCADPNAPWIEDKLKELEKEGIYCKDLVQP